MQRNPRYFPGNSPPDAAYDANGYAFDAAAGGYYGYGGGAPVAGHEHQHDFPAPLNNIEFQPSETCPKNFVIFDQTYRKSRVMFHPSLAHKFGSPGFDAYGAHAHEAGKSVYRDNDEETEDIDALLSSEEGEGEGEDDDVVSTGRTPGGRGGDSPDTACSSQSKSGNAGSSGGTGKRDKMKKMVKTLRGIIPGGDRMDTPAVLDEAVKYLKSLKVEVKKLGMKHLDN
ncbi:hypothetical protein Cni_G10948 [Canna indica]|uniref:BHLH domain-containing protein n=1 Tax=Canna indica TaxID=4628 RepID=A0AAQ3K5Q0_9LILI|nr:hypothetical protein Cni_G10948 [Canna indica]